MQAARGLKGWPLWGVPLPLRVYVIVVVVAAAGAVGWLGWRDHPSIEQFAVLGLFISCAVIVRETSRGFLRGLSVEGFNQDLNSCWKLPIMLLLPPVFAAIAPIFFTVYWQWSARRQQVRHRQMFTIASISLGDAAGSALFHTLTAPVTPILLWFAIAVLAAAVSRLCNYAFVGIVLWLTQPSGLRQLFDREGLMYTGVELCTGLIVAIIGQQALLLILLAVPPVILLHRSLLHEHLRTVSRTDAKTSVLNAGAWEHDAELEIVRANGQQPISALICDIDHFKRVNDAHGHLAGDAALRAIAKRLQGQLRSSDALGRFGGEEFVVLLPDTGTQDAKMIAERLRGAVCDDPIVLEPATLTLSVSLGVATMYAEGTLAEMLAAADEALYTAKRSGRNQVVVARKLRPARDVHAHEEHPKDIGSTEPATGDGSGDADSESHARSAS